MSRKDATRRWVTNNIKPVTKGYVETIKDMVVKLEKHVLDQDQGKRVKNT